MAKCEFAKPIAPHTFLCEIFKSKKNDHYLVCDGRTPACMGRGDEIYDIRDKEIEDGRKQKAAPRAEAGGSTATGD